MPITQWPEEERPREKLLQRGPRALTDAELLAIFLRTGVAGRSAVDLARDLLQAFGGLRGLFSANQKQFCAHKGLGLAKFAQLQAVLEMSQRYLAETMQRPSLTDSQAVRAFFKSQLYHRPDEVFACLFLDQRHRVLRYEELFQGTLDGASVHPRAVVRRALEINAAALIFAHNHPSGVAEPSQADIRITHRLKEALALIEVRVLDHVIIGEGEGVSLAERGLL